MLNLGCGQYLRNPFFPGFWGQKWGCGFCILADYTRLYTVVLVQPRKTLPDITEKIVNWDIKIQIKQTNANFSIF